MIFPAVHFGTVSTTATRILGVVPPEGPGITVRQVDLFLGAQIEPSLDNHWSLELGVVGGLDTFVPRFKTGHPTRGICAGRTEYPVPGPAAFGPGEVVAVRMVENGAPADLTDADAVVHTEEA